MHLHRERTGHLDDAERKSGTLKTARALPKFIALAGVCAALWSPNALALQTVTLAWDANSETNIAGYKLYLGGASRAYTNVSNVGNALSASVNLPEGSTYYFAVTAVNTMGAESDYSAEVSHSVPAIVSRITITTTGSGSVSPNLNGQLLNVGWPYTVRAVPSSGHAFRNWSGDISANTTQLTFTMRSNLALVANFYDNTRPLIAVTSPAGNVRVTNGAVTISGTASDNVGVNRVLYRLGSGSFQPASGTTTWSANPPLAAGLNVLEVKSVDAEGNESVVASRYITNAVMAAMTVNLAGSGTITPNYNGQLLEVGRSYTMEARAASGFTFSGWTGSLSSTASQLTFVMQPGLSVTANFTDGSSPTIAMTAPLAGTRTTNATVTVRGTASDNGSVAQVLCKVNDGPFEVADGTTSWSRQMSLRAGTNRICVKAVDSSGRESAELSRTVTFAAMEPVGVTVNGRGTLNMIVAGKKKPFRNGQRLEIGKRYTVTVTPGTGFVFTNWTGSVLTNRRTITFAMQSNTVLSANLVDVAKPRVGITYPLANVRLTNASVTVRGKASDNRNVAQVLVSLNDGPFQIASGTTNWSLPLTLAAGVNRLRVKAVDVTGWESATTNRSVVHVVMLPMIVGISGSGTLTPNLNGKLLEVGKKYTMTATPGAGYILSNWVGSVTSESAALSFTMHSNATVTAQFVANPFPAVKGNYNGLFYEASGVEHHSSGFLKVTVTDRGSFSATLRGAGRTNSFTGQFNAGGRAQKSVVRTGLPALHVDLQLALGTGREELTGTISDGSWSAGYLGDRADWNTTNNPYQGRFSIVLPGEEGDVATPAGHGSGAALIDRAGNLLLAGRSGDGQLLSQAVPVSRGGEWPLYVPLYARKGSMLGWLTLTNDPAAPVNGLVSWIKSPSTATAFYRAGFSNELTVAGSSYVGSTTERVIRMDQGAVIALGGNLAQAVTNFVQLTPTSGILVAPGTGFTMTLDRTTGRFSGSFRIPGTSTSRTFYGSLLQNRDEGYGYFLGSDQSGQIHFVPVTTPQ